VNGAAENFIADTLKKISDINDDGSCFWWNRNKGSIAVKYFKSGAGG